MDTAKQLNRGYKRNQAAISAMIAAYYKATGKTELAHHGGMKSNAQKASASKPGQSAS